MTCQELLTYLSSYLDQELEADLVAAAQRHLLTCQNCQIVLHSTRQVIQLGQRYYRVGIPDDRRARLFATIQAALAARGAEPPAP